MRELIVASWDDLALQQGDKVPATRTVHFSVNGKPYELDLTDANHETFMKDIGKYTEAAHKPDVVDGPAAEPRRKHDLSRRRYLAEMRDFARLNGLRYKTDKDDYYYPVALRNAFEAYRAGAPEPEWRAVYERGAESKKEDS